MRGILKLFQDIIYILYYCRVSKPSVKYLQNTYLGNQISRFPDTETGLYKISNMYQIDTNNMESNSCNKYYLSNKIMLDSSINKSSQQNNRKNCPYSFRKIQNLYIRSNAIYIFYIDSMLHLQRMSKDNRIDTLNLINMFPEGKKYSYYMRSTKHSYYHRVDTIRYFRKILQDIMQDMRRHKDR